MYVRNLTVKTWPSTLRLTLKSCGPTTHPLFHNKSNQTSYVAVAVYRLQKQTLPKYFDQP